MCRLQAFLKRASCSHLSCAMPIVAAVFLCGVQVDAQIPERSFALVPVAVAPRDESQLGVTIIDNEMILIRPPLPVNVILDVRIGNWDPTRQGIGITGFRIEPDPAGYTSGLAGTLTLASLDCYRDEDCRAALGGSCGIGGSSNCGSYGSDCVDHADCPLCPICACLGPSCIAQTQCESCYVSKGRKDAIFGSFVDCQDTAPPPCRWEGELGGDWPPLVAPDPFPEDGYYAGTVVLEVPGDAEGTFTVELFDAPVSALIDVNGTPIEPLQLIPAMITVINCIGPDCQLNGTPDDCDISNGTSPDCNTNEVPDECDVGEGTSPDCNANDVPDECDVTLGTSPDCNANGIPDECDPDVDGDGVTDLCDPCPGETINDEDGDGICFPEDRCPTDALKVSAGACGCGASDVDSDGDTVSDCVDRCPGDDDRRDINDNGVEDCVEGVIPALSEWGVVILALLLLVGARAGFRWRRSPAKTG